MDGDWQSDQKIPMDSNRKNIFLDFLRGVASLVVCAGHIRNFVFVDFKDVQSPTLLDVAFYFMTGLGHQAVIVFFAMSGFLVGGSICDKMQAKRFQMQEYSIDRLSRLWIVLIPSLIATFILDKLGSAVSGGLGYDGRFSMILSSGPGLNGNFLSSSVFLGNVLFLQTIAVPVYGSNGPLWSLANEFWYYAIFPLIAFGFYNRSIKWIGIAILSMSLLIFLPTGISSGFVFWTFGAAGAIILRRNDRLAGKSFAIVSTALFLISLLVTRHLDGFAADSLVAAATTAMLVNSASFKVEALWIRRGIEQLSGISFSIYLFHFPFIAFLWFCYMAPKQLAPGVVAYTFFSLVLCLTLIYCILFWWLFERKTDRIRLWIKSKTTKNAVPQSNQLPHRDY